MSDKGRRGTTKTFFGGMLMAATLATLATAVFPQVPQSTEKRSSVAADVKKQSSGAQNDGSNNPAAAQEDLLYREYKGVSLRMSADAVREKLGKPKERGDTMDFFIFSDEERARVYYDGEQKVRALIVTYLGQGNSGAPSPASILGSEIEKKSDGSMYKMVIYPKAGYWVAYSRTPGDSPLVMITLQKSR